MLDTYVPPTGRVFAGALLAFLIAINTPAIPISGWVFAVVAVVVSPVAVLTLALWTVGMWRHVEPPRPQDDMINAEAVFPTGERQPIKVMVRREFSPEFGLYVVSKYETAVRLPPRVRLDLGEYRPKSVSPTS